MTRRDTVFLSVVFVIIIFVFLAVNVFFSKKAGYIEITVDGNQVGIYSLTEDVTVPIENRDYIGNTLTIKDGFAYMSYADCPDKTCIRQGKIYKDGQTIVCLPHKVIVRAYSSDKTDDVMVQ